MTPPHPTLPPPPPPTWEDPAPPNPGAVERLARELSLPRPFSALLAGRGFSDPDRVRDYLRPRLEHLAPPERLPDAEVAVARIAEALDGGETIFVHGDYDVDGVAATAILTRWLRHLGGKVVPFVPHRTRHGYDLGPAGVAAAREAGATLLLTCDSGIVAHEAVAEARAAGMDVIVTDHHTPGATLPPALAVVNPLRGGPDDPQAVLCGAGIAWRLCQLLQARRGGDPELLSRLLALVALATVADLVPLRGENRVLTAFGMRHVEHTTLPGLRALKEAAGVTGAVGDRELGYVLGPRVNAVGRMGAAERALELFLTDDPARARVLAAELEEANELRRAEDARTLEEALELLSRSYDPERDFGVVLAREGWHPGVIGIVASRVVERIHRPVIMVALEEGRGRGSARSIAGVHLYQALQGCASHLDRFGGHRQAAGLDLPEAELEPFRSAFSQAVEEQLGGIPPLPALQPELELPVEEATEEIHRLVEHMAPFGMGNRRPLFRARGARVAGTPRVVGKDHLKLRLAPGNGGRGADLEAIGFGLASRVPPATLSGASVDVLYRLRTNEWKGRTTLQAQLLDLRPHAPARPGEGGGDGAAPPADFPRTTR